MGHHGDEARGRSLVQSGAGFVFRTIQRRRPVHFGEWKKLFFCSNRPLEKKGAEKKDFDIWVVERDGDDSSKPKHMGAPVNSGESEFYPSLTKDGTLYFQSQRHDSRGSKDIYRSRPVDGKYKKIENVGDVINSELFEGDVLIAPEEDFMIYSVDRPDGFGRGDLYISFRTENDVWTAPKNMGNQINSEFNENRRYSHPTENSSFSPAMTISTGWMRASSRGSGRTACALSKQRIGPPQETAAAPMAAI